MINIYDLWFSNLDICNKTKIKLMDKFGDTKNIWSFKRIDLSDYEDFDDKTIVKIFDEKSKINLEKYVNYLENKNIKLISYKDDIYPTSLNNIFDKPAFLYIRGNTQNLYMQNVAIVGSRNASYYGKNVARKISREIADKNVNIVSGLALGIDKYAHLGALDSKIGNTIAVLGTGVADEEFYPLENKKVFDRILENKGTIISEYKIGTKPKRYNFPYRNRIISMFSDAVAVIEAKKKSGTLITTDYALKYGKEIFAVPGRVSDILSEGCNELIKSGAYILTEAEDMLFATGVYFDDKKKKKRKNKKILLEKENEVVYSCLDLLPQSINEIVEKTGI